MRTILFLLSFLIFPFNLLFYRAFFPKQTVPTIRIQHEDVTSGLGEAKRSLGRQAGKNVANRFS